MKIDQNDLSVGTNTDKETVATNIYDHTRIVPKSDLQKTNSDPNLQTNPEAFVETEYVWGR